MSRSQPHPSVFLYTGQSKEDIPRRLVHVKVDPSVNVIEDATFKGCRHLVLVELYEGLECIKNWAFGNCVSLRHIRIPLSVKVIGSFAFSDCTQLRNVELNENLEFINPHAFSHCSSLQRINIPSLVKVIDAGSFICCTSLKQIIIPSSVKEIRSRAFSGCTQLRDAELCEGLKEIRDSTFDECTSLQRINIPSSVKVIGGGAFRGCESLKKICIPSSIKEIRSRTFSGCKQLTDAELQEGLKEIWGLAFEGCTSLQRINIPSSVREIAEDAFEGCRSLVNIQFCREVEDFVSDASLREWWNNGFHELSLRTYSFLVKDDVPNRLGQIYARALKNNIYALFQRIPLVFSSDGEEDGYDDDDDKYEYFKLIDDRITICKYLQDDVVPLLELALWKSEMTEQLKCNLTNEQATKSQCRENSLMAVTVIIPNVMSFL